MVPIIEATLDFYQLDMTALVLRVIETENAYECTTEAATEAG
jgi:hypothetical protein